jgi:translocation and assembly module TamB
VVALVGLLQLPPVATVVVRKLLTLAPLKPGYGLQVGRVSGNFFGGLTLEDLRLRQSGRELAYVQRVRVTYRLPRVPPPNTRIDALEVQGARVTTRRVGTSWDILDAMSKSSNAGGGGGFSIGRLQVKDVAVSARLSADSVARVRVIDLEGRDLVTGKRTLLAIDALDLAVQPPATGRWFTVSTQGGLTPQEIRLDPLRIHTELSDLSGRAVIPRDFDDARMVDRLDVRLAARPLDLADLAAVVPSVPGSGKLQFDARAGAEGDLITAHLAATLDQARVTLDGGTRLRRGRPTSYRLHGVMSGLDPSRLHTTAPAGKISGQLDAEVDGPLPQANGSARLRLDGSKLGAMTVRRLDLGALFTEGNADLTLRGALDSGVVDATGRARPFDSIPSYRLSGAARGMAGTAAVARALAGQAGNPALVIGFRLAGRGTSPQSASVGGRVDLTAAPDSGERVAIGHATLRLAEGRLDLRPELLAGGGRITAVGRVTFGDTMSYELRQGRIDRVDLGRLTRDTVSAPLSGRFSVAGRGTAPAVARATARLHFDELRYGQRRVERVDAVIRLDRGRMRLEADGALQGGRLVLEALGRPFDSTASYILRRAALDSVDLGAFLGRPELAGPVTLRLTGEGRWRGGERSVRARLTLDPSRVGRIEVTAGDANVRLAGGQLSYDASLQSGVGALSLAGGGTPTADVPAYQIRDGKLTSVDLGALLGRPDLHTDINTSFTADVAGRGGDSLQATLQLALQPSRVNQAELSAGSLDARVQGRNLEAKLRAQGPDGTLQAELSRRTAGARSLVKTGGTLQVEHLARWSGRRDADGRLESSFALQAETDTAGLRSAGGTVDAVGGIGGVRVRTFHVAMTPVDGELRIDTLQLRSNVAVADGGGRLALRTGAPEGKLALAATLGDLGPVAALAGADTVAFDSARVNLTAAGPAWQWRLDGGVDAHGLTFGGNLANRATLKGTATLDSNHVSALAGELSVKDAAYGRLSLREVTASGRYDSTLALNFALNVGDSVRVATQLRGAVSKTRDTLRADLERLTLDEGGRAWALERPASLVLGPRVELHDLALRAGRRSITVNGVLDRRDSSDMTLRITGLDLETLRASGLAPVGGRLDGYLHLLGPAAAPRLQGRIGLAILSKRRQQIGMLVNDLDWTSRGLRIATVARPNRGGALTVEGTLPYRLTLAPRDTSAAAGVERSEADTVSLAVRADSFNLTLFEPLLPPLVAREIHGRLQADAHIGGSIRAPQATGTVSLAGGALEIIPIKVAYVHGQMEARLQGDVLTIDRFGIRTGKKHELTASGAVRLRPLNEPGLDLAAALAHFQLVNSNQLQTSASGKIQLSGTLLAPSLRGTLVLDRTNFFVGTGAAQAKVEQVELTPEDLRRLARDFGPTVLARAHQAPGLMDRVKLDLDITMPRQVWIRRTSTPKTNIELAGRLKLRQEPGQEMQFFGQVEPVPNRGTIELSGREFRLTDGDIYLAGPVDSTKLDVNASYQVPTQSGGDNEGVLIGVHATGRLDSLGLEFTSDPTLSQDDILSYIVTGRPASDNPLFEQQLGGGGGNTGEQVAFSTLAGAISNTAGQGLGFDVFQIRQDPTRGLTLTAGRYLGSRLFMDLQLPLQVSSQNRQAGTSLGPGFELEYTLRRWLRANMRGGSLSPGILFRARRAY